MKPLLHILTFLTLTIGCDLIQPGPPELLPEGYFMPTLAAATLTVRNNSTPNNPVTPVAGQCENCQGTGKIPARPDHPEDPSKITCPVCEGSGRTNDKMSLKLPGTNSTPLITGPIVSGPATGGHPTNGEPGLKQQPQADDYKQIIYVPIETALAESKRTGRPIWVHVYGEGWCAECVRLDRDVFTDKEVIKASRNFVCTKVEWRHPWRPGLTAGVNGVPLDLFGSDWKNLVRHYCPKTPAGYVKQLSSKSKGVQ